MAKRRAEPARRLRSTPAAGQPPRADSAIVPAASSPGPGLASPPEKQRLNVSAQGEDSLLALVHQAAGQLADDEQSALCDPSFRDQAARWRTGSESRRISAAFARFINSLHIIRPGWLKPQAVRMAPDEPPMVDPLPVHPPRAGRTTLSTMAWCVQTGSKVCENVCAWCMTRWRTLMIVLICLAFPRVVALLCAALFRMLVRAVAAVVCRVLQEVWSELKLGLHQISLASTSVESMVLEQLEGILMDPQPPPAPPVQHQPAMHWQPVNAPVSNPPPAPPWAFFSMLLLLLLVALQLLPLIRTGGVGDRNAG